MRRRRQRVDWESRIAAVLACAGAASVYLYHYLVEPLPFPFLGAVAAFIAMVFLTLFAGSCMRRFQRPRVAKLSRHLDLVAAEPPVEEPLVIPPPPSPQQAALRTTAADLRAFGTITAIVCVPCGVMATVRWWPLAAAALLIATALSALQSLACFVVARRLEAPTRGVYWAAALLLCIELPAFPLTLWAVQGLYYLYRGSRSEMTIASSADAAVAG